MIELSGSNRPSRSWAIVLAGGEGVRLRPLVREVFGDNRPKQYARLLGSRSLLGQTLDRVGLSIGAERTLVVTMAQHAGYIAEELAHRPRPVVVVQPADRGTLAGILYPAHRVSWRDPEATVAVFPSDHLVVAEAEFMAHVAEVVRWVERTPERAVLLGAPASSPEIEYGWIEPAEPLGEISSGPVRAVRRFWEKPSQGQAQACLAAGHVWNTSVIVAKVRVLLELGRLALPGLDDRLTRIRHFVGTPEEPAAIHQAYELLPNGNFSHAVLETYPGRFAVSRLPRVGWSDLGSPSRVMEAITEMSTPPDWARVLVKSA